MRAQFPGARQAPLGDESRERRRYKRIDANVKRLAEGARVDPQAREDLYARVGRIVSELQSMGYRNHAAVIADESGVEVKQAHAWVRRARERGYLTADPYKRGRPKAGS